MTTSGHLTASETLDNGVTDKRISEMNPKENQVEKEYLSSDSEKESDFEPSRDSNSSPDVPTVEEIKVKRTSRVPEKLSKKTIPASSLRTSKVNPRDRRESNRLQFKPSKNSQISSQRPEKVTPLVTKDLPEFKPTEFKAQETPSESSEGSSEKNTEEKTVEIEETSLDDTKSNQQPKIEEMEMRIQKLEQELREVAALEISLYSVVPEHGSSSHKLHTPARRLSRLYIHACKLWTQDQKATVAKNIVSGLVLVTRSCGNDVSRLTFWLSNTVFLRVIISQAFGVSSYSSYIKENRFSPQKGSPNGISGIHVRNLGILPLMDDWQETGTFTRALEKIESWIFSRIVESIWWQTLAPHMQSPRKEQLNDDDGSFSVNLWKNAFGEAFKRLCPVREGKHKCGCLPALSRMVMEQCVARLDVAMFNALLRESENEIPTDPVSDPIVDNNVLPVLAGDLSFGSGAQLKNSIGNWSRWLVEMFGGDCDTNGGMDEDGGEEEDHRQGAGGMSKMFPLLNSLSDLLMLPKDMLLVKSIRKEVCPKIGLPVITRILCNFAPDEFCPDPVPGIILEELNAEILLERRTHQDKGLVNSIPCSADPILYIPPPPADVADADGTWPSLGRSTSIIQRRGHTSDDDLDDLDSPLSSFIDPNQVNARNGNRVGRSNVRFKLLEEVWRE